MNAAIRTGRPCLLLGCCIALAAEAADLPPVNLSGQLSATYRLSQPEEGEQVSQTAWTAQLNADSYLWQPWFGLWYARLGFTQVNTDREVDTDTRLFTGEGRLRLFPESRFPLEAYFDVQDTRVGVDDPFADVGSFRYTRFGVQQQYRAEDGSAVYSVRLEQSAQQDLAGADDQQVSRIQLDLTQRLNERHTVASRLHIEDARRDENREDLRDVNFTARHSYRRDDRLSVESYASLNQFDDSTDLLDRQERRLLVNSFALWRAERLPLTVNANVLVLANVDDLNGEQRQRNSTNLALGANYELTKALRISGLFGTTLRGGDPDPDTGTEPAGSAFQTLTLDYRPAPIALRGFSYHWSGTATGRNSTGEEEGDSQALITTVGHGLNRGFHWGGERGVLVAMDASQYLTSDADTRDGDLRTLTHQGALTFSFPSAQPASYLRLGLTDARSSGREQNTLQFLGVSASSNGEWGRYSSWSVDLTVNSGRVATDTAEDDFESSTANLTYRHRRPLGVRGLRFSSALRFQSNSILPLGFGIEHGDGIAWDNRLDYAIGRLNLRLRATVAEIDEQQNKSLFFTVSRDF